MILILTIHPIAELNIINDGDTDSTLKWTENEQSDIVMKSSTLLQHFKIGLFFLVSPDLLWHSELDKALDKTLLQHYMCPQDKTTEESTGLGCLWQGTVYCLTGQWIYNERKSESKTKSEHENKII